MKMFCRFGSFAAAIMFASAAFAQATPVPDAHFSGEVYQVPVTSVHVDSCAEPLFADVKVTRKRDIHPCAVKKVIKVNNPCPDAGCCGPQCVFIEVCAPPCECDEKIECRRDGDRMNYSYGKYGFDVKVRKGFVVVTYKCKGRPGV